MARGSTYKTDRTFACPALMEFAAVPTLIRPLWTFALGPPAVSFGTIASVPFLTIIRASVSMRGLRPPGIRSISPLGPICAWARASMSRPLRRSTPLGCLIIPLIISIISKPVLRLPAEMYLLPGWANKTSTHIVG